MSYVYLISDHHEYGSENVRATLDRSKVLSLLPEDYSDCEPRLRELLQSSDEELAKDYPHNLCGGWGGAQLHVVMLT